jgi:hypothetical protein
MKKRIKMLKYCKVPLGEGGSYMEFHPGHYYYTIFADRLPEDRFEYEGESIFNLSYDSPPKAVIEYTEKDLLETLAEERQASHDFADDDITLGNEPDDLGD